MSSRWFWIGLVVLIASGLASLYFGPAGRTVPLLLVALALFCMSSYLGFGKRDRNPLRHRAQAGAIVFLGLAMLLAYEAWQEQRALRQIRELIEPYDNLRQVSYLPRTSPEQRHHWLVETNDPLEAVVAFYADEKRHDGWERVAPPPMMVLRRGDEELSVLMHADEGGAIIYYELRTASP